MKSSMVWSLVLLLMGAVALTGCCPPWTDDDQATARYEEQDQYALADADQDQVLFYDRPDYTLVQQAIPTGNRSTSVILLEKTAPEEVIVGNAFDYKIRVTNIGDQTLNNVVLTENVPGAFNVMNAQPRPDSTNPMSWRIGRLEPGESRTVTLTAEATDIGSLEACADVTYDLLPPEVCLTVSAVRPMLEVAKIGPERVLLCDDIVYRILVTNTGNGPARNVRVLDPLSEGLTTADGQPQARFMIDQLDPGQSREFTVTAQADRTGEYTNRVQVQADGNLTAESALVRTTVHQPVLEIAKRGPQAAYIGSAITYSLMVRNTGDAPARDAVLIEQLPGGASLVEASGNPDRSGNRMTWQLGTIEPGGQRQVDVTLRFSEMGELRNVATASAYCAEDVMAEALVSIEGIAALLLEVIDLEDPVAVGNNTTYVISVTNQGSAVARDIRISVEVPEQQEFVAAQSPMELQAQGRRVNFAPLPGLDPGDTLTLRVVTRGVTAGDSRFRVTLNSTDLEEPVGELESTKVFSPEDLQRQIQQRQQDQQQQPQQ